MRAYAAARDTGRVEPLASGTTPPGVKRGSLDELIECYYRMVFSTLAESTRAMRRGVLARFRNERARSGQRCGDKSVAGLDHEAITTIICR